MITPAGGKRPNGSLHPPPLPESFRKRPPPAVDPANLAGTKPREPEIVRVGRVRDFQGQQNGRLSLGKNDGVLA